MNKTSLADLAQVADAMYLREFGKIRSILEEENRLLRDLDRLNAQVRDNRNPEMAMLSIGADILWQGWEARTRRQLNTELAQIRARKLIMMDKVRSAFGRKHAIESMMQQEKTDKAQLRQRRALEKLTETFAMRNGSGN